MALNQKLSWLQKPERESHTFLGPTQSGLKTFIEKSKKNQTLHANCEGFYSRRIVSLSNKIDLHCFICCTLFYEDCLDYTYEMKNSMVSGIEKFMIEKSKCYNTPGEVHFSVIWVNYYVDEESIVKATPLFKIFKKKQNSDEAIFFDVYFNTYDGWDHYLDNAKFPTSFMCVPRNGAYIFQPDSESLDLIYIFPKASPSAKSLISVQSAFRPFCESIVRPMFSKLKTVKLACIEMIKNLVSFLSNAWENKRKLLGGLIYAISLGLDIYSRDLPSKWNFLPKIVQSSYMLLNSSEKGNHLMAYMSESPIINPTFEGQNNLKVSESATLDWDAIFLKFTEIFQACPFELFSKSFPNVWIVKCILGTILLAANLIKISLQHEATKPAIVSGTDLPCSTNTVTSPLPLQSILAKNEKDLVEVTAVQELVTNLENIENISFEKIGEETYKKFNSTRDNRIALSLAPLEVPVDDCFPGALYIFSSATFQQITDGFRTILKDDFMYKPRNNHTYDVIDNENKVQATLYIKENLAFAYSPRKTPI